MTADEYQSLVYVVNALLKQQRDADVVQLVSGVLDILDRAGGNDGGPAIQGAEVAGDPAGPSLIQPLLEPFLSTLPPRLFVYTGEGGSPVVADLPEVVTPEIGYALALARTGNPHDAIAVLEDVLRDADDDHAARYWLVELLAGQMPIDLAAFERHATKLCEAPPESCASERFVNLARLAQGVGSMSLAERAWQVVTEREPDHLGAWLQLMMLQLQSRQDSAALQTTERLCALAPTDHRWHCNRSYLLERLGRAAEAEVAARTAINCRSDVPEAWNNLGVALRAQRRWAAAEEAWQQGLSLAPQFHEMAFNLGLLQLLRGEYHDGWEGYEQRVHLSQHVDEMPTLAPQWQGERLTVSGVHERPRLWVHADQGLGDALQFVRFLPRARAQSGAEIVLTCAASLLPLLNGAHGMVAGIDAINSEPPRTGSVTAQISLSSLPLRLQIDDAAIRECAPPYLPLVAPAAGSFRTAGAAVRHPGSRWRVGLVWQGNPAQRLDHVRSCPLADCRVWQRIPNIDWFSLQLEPKGRDQLRDVCSTWPITDCADQLGDLAATARLIQSLDLVITVDTAVAHLAGAMGHPVWVLLSYAADWRYGLDDDRCVWYPSMRLFRQPQWGDWPATADAVARALRALVGAAAA